MVFKSILGSAGLATLLFSTSILSGPVGPFGQLVRDAKAGTKLTTTSLPVEKRDPLALPSDDDEDEGLDTEGSASAMRFLNAKTTGMIS